MKKFDRRFTKAIEDARKKIPNQLEMLENREFLGQGETDSPKSH